MRVLLMVLLLSMNASSLINTDSNDCVIIRKESRDLIGCSLFGGVYSLEYHNKMTYRLVKWSGERGHMLRELCQGAVKVIENVDGKVVHTTYCKDKK